MHVELSDSDARQLRTRAQLLEKGKKRSALEVVRKLVGLQAQDPGAASLQARARSSGLAREDVREALVGNRSIVRAWCMRGTLHLVSADDLRWIVSLLGERFITAGGRRRAELGLDERSTERGVRVIVEALSENGPLSRNMLFDRLAAAGIPHEGQAGIHLVRTAGLEGHLCYGPEQNGQETFVLVNDWIKGVRPLSDKDAAVELARRYVSAYGPATPRDFTWWSGLDLKRAETAFRGIGGRLAQVDVAGVAMWVLTTRFEEDEDPSRRKDVILLPRFDPYLLGYRDRALVLDPRFDKEVNAGGGIIRPVVVAGGRVAATWSMAQGKDGLIVNVKPFVGLSRSETAGLKAEVADIGRFEHMASRLQILE